jgi:hypothetical protein
MNVEFLAPARVEFAEAVGSCGAQPTGFGHEFAAEVRWAIEGILRYPAWWLMRSRRTRCRPTNRFAYGIVATSKTRRGHGADMQTGAAVKAILVGACHGFRLFYAE